jgi:phosphomannomutase
MTEHELLGGTDGVRGTATDELGPGLINEETFAGLSYALVSMQQEQGLRGPVIVAQDTRPSGEALRHASIDGALARNADVWDFGVAPTPMAQKIGQEVGALAVIVNSASHNDAPDNGWKGMPSSRKPHGPEVHAISDRYWQQVDSGLRIPRDQWHKATEMPELSRLYIHEVVRDIEGVFGHVPLEGKRFVVDGANGAAQYVTPEVLEALGAKVDRFNCNGEGLINAGCGAAHTEGVQKFLEDNPEITEDPDFVGAIANDGDGDRVMTLGVVQTAEGPQIVRLDGNHVMVAHAEGQPGIVGTHYANTGLVTYLQEKGIDFERCPTGDVNVTKALRDRQNRGQHWKRGFEPSGHHIDTDWLSSGDGTYMAAWFAAWAVQNKKTFGDVHESIPLWPERKEDIKLASVAEGKYLLEHPTVRNTLLTAEEDFGGTSRVVSRNSGTEKALRLWVEAQEVSQAESILRALTQAVKLARQES